MDKEKTTATTRRTQDWRKEMDGATPERLAKALLGADWEDEEE